MPEKIVKDLIQQYLNGEIRPLLRELYEKFKDKLNNITYEEFEKKYLNKFSDL